MRGKKFWGRSDSALRYFAISTSQQSLLDRHIVHDADVAEENYAPIGQARITFKAAVVEYVARLVELKANPGFSFDVGSEVPPSARAVHVYLPVHPDVQQRDAIGLTVRADRSQPAAEPPLHEFQRSFLCRDPVGTPDRRRGA